MLRGDMDYFTRRLLAKIDGSYVEPAVSPSALAHTTVSVLGVVVDYEFLHGLVGGGMSLSEKQVFQIENEIPYEDKLRRAEYFISASGQQNFEIACFLIFSHLEKTLRDFVLQFSSSTERGILSYAKWLRAHQRYKEHFSNELYRSIKESVSQFRNPVFHGVDVVLDYTLLSNALKVAKKTYEQIILLRNHN